MIYRTLENHPKLRKILRNIVLKYWFLKPYALKAFIFYHVNYLISFKSPVKKYSLGIITGPRGFFEKGGFLSGEEVIMDVISGLQIDGVCVDAGAWVGKYSLLMAKKAKRVICIEPNRMNYKFIKKNIELNKIKNIEPIQAALDANDGFAKLYVSPYTAGHSLVRYGYGYKVKTISLKSLLDHIGENVDLVKMDIEAAEFNVLPSLDKNIANMVKYWIVECHTTTNKEDDFKLVNIFKKNGYLVKWIIQKNPSEVRYIFAYRQEEKNQPNLDIVDKYLSTNL